MLVNFTDPKMAKSCADDKSMVRAFGSERAKHVKRRLGALRDTAENLADMRHLPGHTHELHGNWAGYLAIDLDGAYRLIFAPNPRVTKADGGLDWAEVKAIAIVTIENYHD